MARIFISYSQDDYPFVAGLTEALTRRGHEVRTDFTVLLPGREWTAILREQLRTADICVAIISPASRQSPFVMTEIGAALAYGRESRRMLVIPVVLPAGELPAPLVDIQAIMNADDPERVAADIQLAIADFEGTRAAVQDRQEEERRRIEQNADTYVQDAVGPQRDAEKRYRWLGLLWYIAGLIALFAGFAFAARSLAHMIIPGGDWTQFALVALRTVLVITLLAACGKYAFTLGRSYTIESLKCADRLHAINFGRFYLRVYGQEAQWQEVKEAFANWNIDRPSAFTDTRPSDFDPQVIELLTRVVGAMSAEKKG